MRKTRSIIALFLTTFFTCSCASNYVYEIKDYSIDLQYKDDFRILQLSDLHFSNTLIFEEEFKYLDKLIELARADMIVLSGDNFMNSNANTIRGLYDYIDSKDIPWSLVYGNHDKQGTTSPRFLFDYVKTKKNAAYKEVMNDGVYGESNYIVNLKRNRKTIWQLYMIDSGSYVDTGFRYRYDAIREEQINWYEKSVLKTKEIEGDIVPSVAFFHIPLYEYKTAWDLHHNDPTKCQGDKNENISHGHENTGFFAKMKELSSTKATFVGHDHVNDFAVLYEGIMLSYGTKTGHNIYHDENKMGGQVITLRSNGEIGLDDIERIHLKY